MPKTHAADLPTVETLRKSLQIERDIVANLEAQLNDALLAQNEDSEAIDFISGVLHDNLCGKVPGYKNADLFVAHGKMSRAILDVLKAGYVR